MTASTDGRARDRSVLEEEREFFLRSLRDLDAEHGAGDIDDVDYRSLRDDYTVRAADVVRQLASFDRPNGALAPSVESAPSGAAGDEPSAVPSDAAAPAAGASGPAPEEAGAPATGASGPAPEEAGASATQPAWRRPWVLVAAALIVAAGVAWASVGVFGSSGSKEQRVVSLRARALTALGKGDAKVAITDYAAALRLDPTDPVSLTDEGIVFLFASGDRPNALLTEALTDFRAAETDHPSYGQAYGWKGIALYYEGQYRAAIPQFRTYLADVRGGGQSATIEKELALASKKVAGKS